MIPELQKQDEINEIIGLNSAIQKSCSVSFSIIGDSVKSYTVTRIHIDLMRFIFS